MINKQLLKTLATYSAPIPPAIAFGNATYTYSIEVGMHAYLAIVAAVCAGIALETIGIFAGKSALEAWRQNKIMEMIISAIGLGAYTFIGVYELFGTPYMWFTIIAFIGYVMAGVTEVLDKYESSAIEKSEDTKAINAEDKKESRAYMQEARLAKIDADKEVKLAKLKLQANQATLKPALSEPKPAVSYPCKCGKLFKSKQAVSAHWAFCKVNPNSRLVKNGVPAHG